MTKTKNLKDLKKIISNFKHFKENLVKFKNFIDTGKLAEYYCIVLYELKLIKPHNASFDALTSDNKKVEIKHRVHKGSILPGMKINLESIDQVYYVELDQNLLPIKIHKILVTDLEYSTGKRVSFKKVFDLKKNQVIFER